MKPKYRRLIKICMALISISGGVWIVSQTLRTSLVYYVTPSELIHDQPRTEVRLGGQVVSGSVSRSDRSCRFTVSDGHQKIFVDYEGLLPALFREGQGVVAEGTWCAPIFQATRLLVKHNEYYRPPVDTAQ